MSENEQKTKLLCGKTTHLPFTVNALQVCVLLFLILFSSNVYSKVMVKRYLLKDHSGTILETPEEMFMRVAKALAQVEYTYDATEEEVHHLQKEFYDVRSQVLNGSI